MAKGIDQKFVHYGIRKDDLSMIEAICDAEDIDSDWLREEIFKALIRVRITSCNGKIKCIPVFIYF